MYDVSENTLNFVHQPFEPEPEPEPAIFLMTEPYLPVV